MKRKEKMKKKEKADKGEKGERKAESEASLVTKATKNFSADKNERLSLAAFEVPITHSLSPPLAHTLSLSFSLSTFPSPKNGTPQKVLFEKESERFFFCP